MHDARAVDLLGEAGHVVGRRREHDAVGRVDLLDGTVLHDRDAIGEPQRLVEVVGDEHDALAEHLLQTQELVLHVAPDQRIERRERLVEKPDVRLDREAAGDADTLLLAAGQLARETVLAPFQSDQTDDLERPLAPRVPVLPAHLERVGDVVEHRAVRQQAEALEHHAHLAPAQLDEPAFVERADVLPLDGELSGRRLEQSRQAAHERRLARSRQPHHHEHLAARDVEGDLAHRRHVAGLEDALVGGRPDPPLGERAAEPGFGSLAVLARAVAHAAARAPAEQLPQVPRGRRRPARHRPTPRSTACSRRRAHECRRLDVGGFEPGGARGRSIPRRQRTTPTAHASHGSP